MAHIHNYLTNIDPNSHIYVYDAISINSVSAFINRIHHTTPPFTDKPIRHIFVIKLVTIGDSNYIHDTFIPSSDFLSILTSTIIPHNQHVEILYVTENKPKNTISGNDFVVSYTIDTCNTALSHMFRHMNKWINDIYHSQHIIGSLNEYIITDLLHADHNIDSRRIDTYFEDIVLCKVFLELLSNTTDIGIINSSLYSILTTLDNRLDITIPPTLTFGISGIITPQIITALFNIDKITYHTTTIDDILSISICPRMIKEYIIDGY